MAKRIWKLPSGVQLEFNSGAMDIVWPGKTEPVLATRSAEETLEWIEVMRLEVERCKKERGDDQSN